MAPAAAGVITGSVHPRFKASSDGGTRLACADVTTEVSVSSTVTPNILQCIPYTASAWLRGVAANWSKWRWLSLKFIYIPTCPTSVSGSVHMGFLYDQSDSTPATVAEMAALRGYTTGPVWSGSEAAVMLSDVSRACPPGAICASLDVTKLSKPWYSYVTSTTLTTSITLDPSLGNIYVPARLVILTADGSATDAVSVGRLYVQYEVELIERIVASDNL